MPNARKSEKSKGKTERVPFGAHRTKLQVEDGINGQVLRWFNDMDGRIERALDGGYQFVKPGEVPRLGQGQIHEDNSDLNTKVSKIVSRGTDKPIRAYLMKIRKSWYDKDQAAKEAINAEIDEALRNNAPGGNVVDNQYVPKGHVQKI
jgi:hypothetical protein